MLEVLEENFEHDLFILKVSWEMLIATENHILLAWAVDFTLLDKKKMKCIHVIVCHVNAHCS